jgi:hypothetical protein
VVSATLWRLPVHLRGAELYQVLRDCIAPERVEEEDSRLPIADSKVLYTAGDSWQQLELGLLSALWHCGRPCQQWREVWRALSPDSLPRVDGEPWHRDFSQPIPRFAPAARVAGYAERLSTALRQAGVALLAVASRPVFPLEFNELLDRYENKSTLLSHVTLELVREVIALANIDGPLLVCCDKHGGRNFYAGLLQHFFSDHFVEVGTEGREKSVYRFGPKQRRVEFRFCAKGEAFLPAALASMACKYLRELSMQAFNEFWRRHVPDLKPTAGYPDDARRFQRDIAIAQRKLSIADEVLWRKR